MLAKVLFMGVFFGLGGVVSAPLSGASDAVTVFAGVAGVLAGMFGTAAAMWRFRKLGSAEKDQIATDAANNAVAALDAALKQYVADLQRALAQVRDLEKELSAAKERIANLEGQLASAESDRVQLQHRLDRALERRNQLETEIAQQRERIHELELRVGGRRFDDPSGPVLESGP